MYIISSWFSLVKYLSLFLEILIILEPTFTKFLSQSSTLKYFKFISKSYKTTFLASNSRHANIEAPFGNARREEVSVSSLSVATSSNRIKNSDEFEKGLCELARIVNELEGEGELSFDKLNLSLFSWPCILLHLIVKHVVLQISSCKNIMEIKYHISFYGYAI